MRVAWWLLLTKGLLLKPHTGFLDSEPAFQLSGGVGAKTWARLVATVFPEFIAREKPGA